MAFVSGGGMSRLVDFNTGNLLPVVPSVEGDAVGACEVGFNFTLFDSVAEVFDFAPTCQDRRIQCLTLQELRLALLILAVCEQSIGTVGAEGAIAPPPIFGLATLPPPHCVTIQLALVSPPPIYKYFLHLCRGFSQYSF